MESQTIVRIYDAARDAEALRACIIEQQEKAWISRLRTSANKVSGLVRADYRCINRGQSNRLSLPVAYWYAVCVYFRSRYDASGRRALSSLLDTSACCVRHGLQFLIDVRHADWSFDATLRGHVECQRVQHRISRWIWNDQRRDGARMPVDGEGRLRLDYLQRADNRSGPGRVAVLGSTKPVDVRAFGRRFHR